MPSNAKAATLTGAQLRHLLRVTAATSRAPERDRLVLLREHGRLQSDSCCQAPLSKETT